MLIPNTMVVKREYPYVPEKRLDSFLDAELIKRLRKRDDGNSYEPATIIRNILNEHNILSEVITFTNDDEGVVIPSGKRYPMYTIVLMGEWVIDVLNEDKEISTKDYVSMLQAANPKLSINILTSTGWYRDDNGMPFMPDIDYLLNYKY